MTSPSQLKYLEAMGIPVWVSRDLYHVRDKESDTESVIGSGPLTSQTSSNTNKPQILSSTGANSAASILQSLNESNDSAEHINTQVAGSKFTKRPTESAASKYKGQTTENNDTPSQNEIARTASHLVYACGDKQADWMIIGESPELNDDRTNQPYSGDSGVLLENMLRAVGLDYPRKDAYLINVIKASLQAIEPESIGELNKILNQKIKEVNPKLLLIVGQLSAQNILQSKEPLARLRAKPHKHSETDTDIIVTYYPTHLLSKPIDKRKAWDDLKVAMKLIGEASE